MPESHSEHHGPLSDEKLKALAEVMADEFEAAPGGSFSIDDIRAATRKADRRIRQSAFVPVMNADGSCPLVEFIQPGATSRLVSLVVPSTGRTPGTSRLLSGTLRRPTVKPATETELASGSFAAELYSLGACSSDADNDETGTALWNPSEDDCPEDDVLDAALHEFEEATFELRLDSAGAAFEVIHAEAAILQGFDLPNVTRTFSWEMLVRHDRLVRPASESVEADRRETRPASVAGALSAKSSESVAITASSEASDATSLSWTLTGNALSVTAGLPDEIETAVVVADLTFESPEGTTTLPHVVTLSRHRDGEPLSGTLTLWVPSEVTTDEVTLTVRDVTARDLAVMDSDTRQQVLKESPASLLVCRTLPNGVELTADRRELDEILSHPRAILGLRVALEGGRANV
ncbi:MAG: hypothetical protein ACI8P0_001305 [Planctomycetaceae bacterium]|jgi:hypothetical protein